MRKLILGLTIALLISPSVLAAFTDVSLNHKNQIAIEYLQQEEVIGGYADGSFRPQNPINRAEMMKILVEGQGISPDGNTYKNCFPDVGNEWFARYVCYAKDKDWVGGYPDNTFKPANNVLDVEAMKMIINARGIELDPTFTSLNFATVPPDAWYRSFLVTAEKFKLTEKFTPGANYKRGEVSEVIFRSIVIEETGSNSYSIQAQNELLNSLNEKPEVSYETASYVDYSPEKRASYEGSKPFAIFFHAGWCPICKGIENELKADLKSYPDGLLLLEADYDTETALKKEFGVTRQYWFVVFDAEGEVTFSNNLFNASDVVEEVIKTL